MARLYPLLPTPVLSAENGSYAVNPSSEVQAAFFKRAITPGAYDGKLLGGPLFRHFKEMRARHTMREGYRAVGEVSLSLLLSNQGVPCILDRPLYRSQGEGESPEIKDKFSKFSGTNACLRMVMDTVVPGWRTDEAVLRRTMAAAHNVKDFSLPNDTAYWNIFQSAAFRDVTDRRVRTAFIAGADFGWLANTVGRIKKLVRGIEAYCAVNYEHQNVIRTGMLLGSGEAPDTVRVLDPQAEHPSDPGWRDMPMRDFSSRWAVCSNAATLIIAHPLPPVR